MREFINPILPGGVAKCPNCNREIEYPKQQLLFGKSVLGIRITCKCGAYLELGRILDEQCSGFWIEKEK